MADTETIFPVVLRVAASPTRRASRSAAVADAQMRLCPAGLWFSDLNAGLPTQASAARAE